MIFFKVQDSSGADVQAQDISEADVQAQDISEADVHVHDADVHVQDGGAANNESDLHDVVNNTSHTVYNYNFDSIIVINL